jgi:hypothetical protein
MEALISSGCKLFANMHMHFTRCKHPVLMFSQLVRRGNKEFIDGYALNPELVHRFIGLHLPGNFC